MDLDSFVRDAPSTEWVVEGLVPANMKGLVVARAGTGKSWFLESLAFAVVTGHDFMGHFLVATPGPVLLIDQDTPEQVLVDRLRALGAMASPKNHILEVEPQGGHALDTREGTDAVLELVRRIRPVLVIIETLDTVTSGSFNENHAMDVVRLFSNLDLIRAECSSAILMSHHFGKKGQVGEPLTWIRGSSVLPARADVGYGLERLRLSGQFVVQPFPKRVKTAPAFRVELKTIELDERLQSAWLVRAGDWDEELGFDLGEKAALVYELVVDRGGEGITVAGVVEASAGYLSEGEARTILRALSHDERPGWQITRGKEGHNRFRFWAPVNLENLREDSLSANPLPTSASELEP